jgi:hypothetical protein
VKACSVSFSVILCCSVVLAGGGGEMEPAYRGPIDEGSTTPISVWLPNESWSVEFAEGSLEVRRTGDPAIVGLFHYYGGGVEPVGDEGVAGFLARYLADEVIERHFPGGSACDYSTNEDIWEARVLVENGDVRSMVILWWYHGDVACLTLESVSGDFSGALEEVRDTSFYYGY